MKQNKQLTLHEKWELDIQSAKMGGAFIILRAQCEICAYEIEGNAENCLKYVNNEHKPNFVMKCQKECPRFKHKYTLKFQALAKKDEQFFGGMFGFFVGDALGVPLEFESRETRKKECIQEMRAYGTYKQYFGTWSDDSSLSLCLIDSLKDGYNLKDIANKFCKFYYESYWTPYNKVFDIGISTAKAIERMKVGINPISCGGNTENDNGNGSLMRILPLAFYLKEKSAFEKIEIIEDISSLTHSHKRSKLACIIYIEFAINLLNSNNKYEAYEKTVDFIMKYCSKSYHSEFDNFKNILLNNIYLYNEDKIFSTGYVIHSIEAALWSFMTTKSYEKAVLKAVNLGGDTDTIAAITGGLAGICYGINSIPSNWIQCLARKEDIYKLLKEFINCCNL